MIKNARIRKAGIVGTVTIVAVGGTTMAVASDRPARGASSTTYYACITPVYKTLNLTTAKATCPDGQRKISFSGRAERGAKGARGSRGVRGADGAPGAPGAQGLPGAQGPVGATGAQGAEGRQGLQGLQGIQGVQGIQGIQGFQGVPGVPGLQGPIGFPGADGAAGPQGPEGAVGPEGQVGPAGATGGAGPIGPQGVQGVAGPVGLTGPQGDPGPIGLTGPQGDPGVAGPAGPAGPQGDPGVTGPAGPAGPQGDQGDPGPAGPEGAVGPAGPAGPAGPTGATGATGPAGPAGSGGGVSLVDANNVTLGSVISSDRYIVTVVTSTGHVLTLNWRGVVGGSVSVYYSGGSCSAGSTKWMSVGGSSQRYVHGKLASYSNTTGSYLVPANVGADGSAASVPMSGVTNIEWQVGVTGEGECDPSSSTSHGVLLQTATPAQVGMPATVAAPLALQ